MANAHETRPARDSGISRARRSMTFIVRTLILVILACIVCIAAFLTAERVSNLYILTSEGMALRAECILADGPRNDLEEYFTLTFLNNDAALADTTYSNYTITSYNYDLRVEKLSVMPWSMTASVICVERVSLKGTINADLIDEGKTADDYTPPAWTNARLRLTFLNNNARWYISEIETLEENPETKAQGTPDPNQTPIPAATPTPKPTDEPSAAPSHTP